MKNLTILFTCAAIFLLPTANCLLPTFSYAQAPQKFNYQGVARGSTGNVFSNQPLGFKLGILQGSPTGTPVYEETQAVTSDSKGIFSLEVGGGAVVSGVFSSIGWGGNSYYLKTEMDTTGGSNYQTMGTTQMISVPYSLYSETTGDTSMWKKNGNNIYRLNGNVGIGTASPNWKLTLNDLTSSFMNWQLGGINKADFGVGSSLGSSKLGIGNLSIWMTVWDLSNGNMGIGTTTPSQKLSVAGVIESTTGGVKFPDGTTQTTAASGSSGGFSNMQVFSSSGTFTTGSGVTKVLVEVWGGGGGGGTGGGSQIGGSGGGGGYGKGILSVTPNTPYTVTVGTGGSGGTSGGNAGSNGGASSFGALISASGGFAGQGTAGSYSGGNGGTSSAAFNIIGEKGVGYSGNTTQQHGGWSPLGGSSGVVPGGGAIGVVSGAGQNGASGRVVVWW